MRSEFWSFRLSRSGLEDLDVVVELWRPALLATVTVAFRVDPSAINATPADLKSRIEQMAESVLTGGLRRWPGETRSPLQAETD